MAVLTNVYASRMDGHELVTHAFVQLDSPAEILRPEQLGLSPVLAAYAMDGNTRYEILVVDGGGLRVLDAPEGPFEAHVTARGRPVRTAREINVDIHPDALDPPRRAA